MLFKVVDDWKQNLHPDDEIRLNEILRNVTKHRAAYRVSKDVKSAQLWCALLELDKKTQNMNYNMEKMQMIITGFADVIKRAEAGEKHEHRCRCEHSHHDSRDTKLIESLEKF